MINASIKSKEATPTFPYLAVHNVSGTVALITDCKSGIILKEGRNPTAYTNVGFGVDAVWINNSHPFHDSITLRNV